MPKIPEGFPERLSEVVFRSGLSSSDIARKTGISNISQIMRGEAGITASRLKALCECLNVSADYLLHGGKNGKKSKGT